MNVQVTLKYLGVFKLVQKVQCEFNFFFFYRMPDLYVGVLIAFIESQSVHDDYFWQCFAATRDYIFGFKSYNLANLNTDGNCSFLNLKHYYFFVSIVEKNCSQIFMLLNMIRIYNKLRQT